MHRDILELLRTMKDAATLAVDMPRFVELQQGALARVASDLHRLAGSHLGTVLLTSLQSPHLKLTRDLPVALQPAEEGFMATYFDVNISMSGDTETEAFDNLRTFIIDTFEFHIEDGPAAFCGKVKPDLPARSSAGDEPGGDRCHGTTTWVCFRSSTASADSSRRTGRQMRRRMRHWSRRCCHSGGAGCHLARWICHPAPQTKALL